MFSKLIHKREVAEKGNDEGGPSACITLYTSFWGRRGGREGQNKELLKISGNWDVYE